MAEFKHKIGSLVRLHGLINAAYNGRFGKVVSVSDLDTTGRITVELQESDCQPLLQQIKIKPENMLTACSHCYKTGDKMQFCSKCRVAGYVVILPHLSLSRNPMSITYFSLTVLSRICTIDIVTENVNETIGSDTKMNVFVLVFEGK